MKLKHHFISILAILCLLALLIGIASCALPAEPAIAPKATTEVITETTIETTESTTEPPTTIIESTTEKPREAGFVDISKLAVVRYLYEEVDGEKIKKPNPEWATADAQYAGKTVKIQGKIGGSHRSNSHGIYVESESNGNIEIKCCFADPKEIEKVIELYNGSLVVVTGQFVSAGEKGELRGCKVELANGRKIVPTKAPEIKGGTCALTAQEFIELELGRNSIRADVLLKGAKVQVTGRVTRKFKTNHWVINDSYYIEIGGAIVCRTLSAGDYEYFNPGDTVTVIGDYGTPAFSRFSCDIHDSVFLKAEP